MLAEAQAVTSKTSLARDSTLWGSTLTQVWWKSAWKATCMSRKQVWVCTWNSGTTPQTRVMPMSSNTCWDVEIISISISELPNLYFQHTVTQVFSFVFWCHSGCSAKKKKKRKIVNYNLKNSVLKSSHCTQQKCLWIEMSETYSKKNGSRWPSFFFCDSMCKESTREWVQVLSCCRLKSCISMTTTEQNTNYYILWT